MSQTDTAEAGAATGKRARVSQRDFINANGEVVDRMEEATGARYTLVQAGKSFDLQFGEAGKPETMFAIFGFHTKVGNVANTVLNDSDSPGTPDDAAGAIGEWLESVNGGTWREAGEGTTRGPKYDNGILAEALVAVLGDKAKGDAGHYQARLDDNKGEVDPANKGYRNKVVAQEAVKTKYWGLAAAKGITKPTASIDTIA
jgi:hypothetical protein